jgi:leucyl-tRNA synthetase
MNPSYDPKALEAAVQAAWTKADAYRVTEDASKPKYYACSMLPYPSGKLHMGHVRNYTINDMLARQLRMKGFNALMPMGWDAFGLPAENAAMTRRSCPREVDRANIADMKAQMQPHGPGVRLEPRNGGLRPRVLQAGTNGCFSKCWNKGIAYRKTQIVNWDPVDQTVLANEQVIDGKGWRSGAIVEKREIPGYYLAITQYAEELSDQTWPTRTTKGWPAGSSAMQENWIGKSVGVNFAFPHTIRGATASWCTGACACSPPAQTRSWA